ncbi:hypothetical protein [Candidatus Rariloculus sp.]|uniref:hypothetical protein n=1 Tax=Candidatus Rariloculus sp. TaxID=3101265 RepID=UPI003D133BE6
MKRTTEAAFESVIEAHLPTHGYISKALSEDGNPTFATVMRITRALGLQVRITA